MLQIRPEQMEEFAGPGRLRFEAKLIALLRGSFPDWAEQQSEEQLRTFVRHGIARATEYGLRTELEVARYVNVMQALGSHFDVQPAHDWARRILENERLSGIERLDRLADALQYRREAEKIKDATERRLSAPTR